MIQRPKGLKDVLPSEVHKWQFVENSFRELCRVYGYKEIRTPIFEYTKLFKRSVGETTDIVNKEMYAAIPDVNLRELREGKKSMDGFFEKLKKEGFTLRPEGTAPVVRAFIEAKLYAETQPTKFCYITTCFRHERPQAGRLRQFNQLGVEMFGSKEATADAEIIAIGDHFLRNMGISNFELKLNSIGCPECKPNYNKALKGYLESKLPHLCDTCNERYENNPMRILDCKTPGCQHELKEAPNMIDHLCGECSDHFELLKSCLDSMDVKYSIDPRIVRGLDYYSKTAFEFISNDLGAQSTICGGGRYDSLVEQIDGPSTPGVGFGLGIERLLMVMESAGFEFPNGDETEVFIAAIGDEALVLGTRLLSNLRKEGVKSEIDHLKRSVKAQFKYADKIGAKYVLVIGEDEIKSGAVSAKNMKTGEKIDFKIDDINQFVSILRSGI